MTLADIAHWIQQPEEELLNFHPFDEGTDHDADDTDTVPLPGSWSHRDGWTLCRTPRPGLLARVRQDGDEPDAA